ncbi:hypothetical protein AB0K09_02620 [Streptomyces sp. NPDC049577]|uniref:hypothetical protein n=1 Tax=Streptomyces sp. NPDC049577 TaxID=3155153 RepID=UPI00342BF786
MSQPDPFEAAATEVLHVAVESAKRAIDIARTVQRSQEAAAAERGPAIQVERIRRLMGPGEAAAFLADASRAAEGAVGEPGLTGDRAGIGRREAEASAAYSLADDARGRAEEFADRGDRPAADAAAADAAALDGSAAMMDRSAGELRAEAAGLYSATAPDGPARVQANGVAAGPAGTLRRAQVVGQCGVTAAPRRGR